MASGAPDAQHGSDANRRGVDRRECTLIGQLVRAEDKLTCVINDMSLWGIGLTVASGAVLEISDRVALTAREFGSVEGEIRWSAHPRYGVAVDQTEQELTPFKEYYDSLNDQAIIDQRLAFLEFEARDFERVRSLRLIIERELPNGLDKLYNQVRTSPVLSTYFPNSGDIEKARDAQIAHWGNIGTGLSSPSYYENVRRIGKAHARIGLEPRWYIDGYGLILSHIVSSVVRARWPRGFAWRGNRNDGEEIGETIAALIKAVFVDMDLSISTYLDQVAEARLLGEAQTVANERSVVADSIGQGLSKLAQKDLTHRITERLPDVYSRLQIDFNTAIEQLRLALESVDDSAKEVRAGAEEISEASDAVSRRTEQQAANLEETAAALSEITERVKRTADGAERAREVVATTQIDANKSDEIVQQAVGAMSKIASSSKEISQIVGLVEEIAFQTNLLALNAGVEAARVGEAGRGFAVVATEVRALAQRSSDAAKRIEDLIARSSSHVREGVQLVAGTGDALRRIAGQVTSLNTVVAEIAASAREQAVGLQEVNAAVSQMDLMTQQNAAIAEKSNAASRSLATESKHLAALIANFDVSRGHQSEPRNARQEKGLDTLTRLARTGNDRLGAAKPLHKLRKAADAKMNLASRADWAEF